MKKVNSIKFSGVKDTVEKQLNSHLEITSSYTLSEDRNQNNSIELSIGEDELIELQFQNGEIKILNIDDLLEQYEDVVIVKDRPDQIELPSSINLSSDSRGKSFNPFSKLIVRKVAPITAEYLVEQIIKKREKEILMFGEGLFKYSSPSKLGGKVTSNTTFNLNEPILVFIHGTASCTTDAFGKIETSINNSVWTALEHKYNNPILAFEHYTLTKTPIENAILLIESLPDNCEIHTITHSRGGLISELLSWQLLEGRDAPFSDLEFEHFSDDKYINHKDFLRTLNTLLQKKIYE